MGGSLAWAIETNEKKKNSIKRLPRKKEITTFDKNELMASFVSNDLNL